MTCNLACCTTCTQLHPGQPCPVIADSTKKDWRPICSACQAGQLLHELACSSKGVCSRSASRASQIEKCIFTVLVHKSGAEATPMVRGGSMALGKHCLRRCSFTVNFSSTNILSLLPQAALSAGVPETTLLGIIFSSFPFLPQSAVPKPKYMGN